MSLKQNDYWLECAKENFDVAIEEGLYSLAQAVIDDVRDAGFDKETVQMEQELKRAQAPSVDELIEHMNYITGVKFRF